MPNVWRITILFLKFSGLERTKIKSGNFCVHLVRVFKNVRCLITCFVIEIRCLAGFIAVYWCMVRACEVRWKSSFLSGKLITSSVCTRRTVKRLPVEAHIYSITKTIQAWPIVSNRKNLILFIEICIIFCHRNAFVSLLGQIFDLDGMIFAMSYATVLSRNRTV